MQSLKAFLSSQRLSHSTWAEDTVTCLKQLPWEMSVLAVFKLPPHKSPIAISSCILGLLHQPASGFCSRWEEGGSELAPVRPSLSSSLYCKMPRVPDIQEGPSLQQSLIFIFRRARHMPSSPSSAWKQYHRNGQCTPDKCQETRKEGIRLGCPRVRMCH